MSSCSAGSLDGGAGRASSFSVTTGTVAVAAMAWNIPGIMNGIICCHGNVDGVVVMTFGLSVFMATLDDCPWKSANNSPFGGVRSVTPWAPVACVSISISLKLHNELLAYQCN